MSTSAHNAFGHSWKALQRLMTSCLLNVKPPWTNKINTKMTGLWNVESTIEQMPLQCWIYNSFNLTANISNVYIKLIIWGRFHHILSPKHIQSNKVQSWNGVFSSHAGAINILWGASEYICRCPSQYLPNTRRRHLPSIYFPRRNKLRDRDFI